jgi:Ribonuclease G/E
LQGAFGPSAFLTRIAAARQALAPPQETAPISRAPTRGRAAGDNGMTQRMLIDARHQEETRVAVLKGNRIEEFDFESADHKQIKGNIYLAKVTRVEPSLQAAFVDFGGNRHGFLAFSEIHPDYYQIPKEDREALLAEEAAHAEEEAALRAAEDGDDEDYEGGADYEGGYDDAEGVTEVDTSERTRSPRSRAAWSKTVSTMTPKRARKPRAKAAVASAVPAARAVARARKPKNCAPSAWPCAAATRSRT